jgi:DNA replication and repair protein RecF
MGVTKLQLTNFRSYADQTIELDPMITLIVGPNATGKTNMLEALFVLATTKSFRAKDSELVRHGQQFYRIGAEIDGADVVLGYQATEHGTEKRARHDNAPKTLLEHLGTLRAVLFEPNDLLIIHGAPERRRRYLDFILTQTDKRFVRTLAQYRRVLHQRNRLLADWRGNTSELFAWNIKLTELASEIDARRRQVVAHITELASGLYADIAGEAATLELTYRGVCTGDYPAQFLRLLESNLSRDIAAGFTTIGPHRDDFTITFKDEPVLAVASRGEMRTVVLALKLAELAYFERHTESKPLLLLDDVFSELDDGRRRYLLQTLGNYQSLITTTNADVSGELSAHHATIRTEELQPVS